jgi:hypothetical protein
MTLRKLGVHFHSFFQSLINFRSISDRKCGFLSHVAFELLEQFFGLGAGVQKAFVPGDADFAAIFGEPGEFDPVGAVLQGDFGYYRENGGGDSRADELCGLGEVGAEVRGGEDFLFPGGSVAEFFEKLDAFGDGELGCLRSLLRPARTFTS